MKRKIIAQGKGGFTIYLPKKWVDTKGVREGQEVDITEVDNALLIQVQAGKKLSVTIDCADYSGNDIRNVLTHVYRKGIDEVVLSQLSDSGYKIVKAIARDLLLGFEITSWKKSVCRLENISEPTDQKYDAVLRRILYIIKESIILVKEDILSKSRVNKAEIKELRESADRFILFCKRVISKEKKVKQPIQEWELLTFLMHIEHTLSYLYASQENLIVRPDTDLIGVFEGLELYFDLFMEAFTHDDMKAIQKINNLKDRFQYGIIAKKLEQGKNALLYSYLRELFRLIQVGTSPLLTRCFQRTFPGI